MTRFPLRYARSNLLLGPGGEAAALYRAETVSYPFLSAAGKWGLLHRLERFLCALAADVSIWRVSRAYPASRYPEELASRLDARHGEEAGWRRYLDGHAERLAGLGSHLPEVYLAVSLAERRGAGGVLRSFSRARRRAEELAGVGAPRPIGSTEMEALLAEEQRVFERIGAVLALRRASTAELQWLLRRAACRGLGEPEIDPNWEPDALLVGDAAGALAYEPLENDLWRPAGAPMTEEASEPPSLVVEAEEGSSYQAMLALGSLAEEAEFPGAAELLFAPLEGAGFPVDAVLHVDWVGNREALAQVRRRILDVEHAYREQLAGSPAGPGQRTEEDRELAREYEAILQSTARPPMARAWISLAVGAPDRAELERRVAELREHYGEVALHRPRGLQHQLFADHLPRADGGATGDYRQQMTVEQLAATVPVASAGVGSAQGPYIGFSPSGAARPVRFDAGEAPRTARPSAVLLAGTLGSGKTVAAQSILFACERAGALCVDIDPKPDHGLDRVQALAGRVEVLELSADPSGRGRLDPLAVGLPELREELASSYLLELLRDPPASWELAIDRAVRDEVRAGGRSLRSVVARLRGGPEEPAREVGEALEVLSDFGLARLGFGGGEEAAVAAAAPVTTIRMPGLTLPDPGASRETYTRAERVSVATLSLVAALALRLVSGDRSRHKVVLLDEAWFLLSSAQGRALVSRLVRLGRAMNATVLLATQRLADLGELAELIGTYFLFGQDSLAEAERGLELIGVEPERAQRLAEYRRGRCLMRDLEGRVGEVQFDLVFPELLAALDTNPREAAA